MTWRASKRKEGTRKTTKQSAVFKTRPRRKNMEIDVENSSISALAADLKLLRASHAKSQQRFEELSQRLVLASHSEHTVRMSVERLKRLQAHLRHRVIQQIQKSPRLPSKKRSEHVNFVSHSKERLTRTFVKAIIDGELELFEDFARHCKASHNEMATVPLQFIPPFEMTQGATQGSEEFYIFFPSLASLCDRICLNSTADRFKMLCSYSTVRGEGLMRILGSYTYEEVDEAKEAVLYPAHSYTNGSRQSQEDSNARRVAHTLIRKSRAWDAEDRRFIYSLNLQYRPLLPIQADMTSSQGNLGLQCFHIHWKRNPEARPRIWSRSIVSPSVVLGRLEVILPCVLVLGNTLYDELAELLSTSVTTELVS